MISNESKFALGTMALLCFLMWGTFRSLKDELKTAQKLQNEIYQSSRMIEKVLENEDRIKLKIDSMPDYDQENAAQWREINRLNMKCEGIHAAN